MKNFILGLALFSASSSIFAKGNDGGWTSTGGGEYIFTRNNPWFMGPSTVKWCIDHGGEDKFSLPVAKAKIEIEKSIEVLASQLRNINDYPGSMTSNDMGNSYKKCGIRKTGTSWESVCSTDLDEENIFTISHNFAYTDNCEDSDMEIILGNYNNPKIKKYIEEIGLENFQNFIGLAIRTNYDQQTLKTKGFIYLAADKGEIQYSGPRNRHYGNNTIWDSHEVMDKDASFPGNIVDKNNRVITEQNLILEPKFKDHTLGILQPIMVHELGHALGFPHYDLKNVMHEDYPANLVYNGIAFKGNFLRDSMVLSRGLIETEINRRIGFEWLADEEHYFRLLKKDAPTIYQFLDVIREVNRFPRDRFFFFDFNNPKYSNKRYVQIAVLAPGTLKYQIQKKYEFILDKKCNLSASESAIRFKYSASGDKVNTVILLNLEDTYYCGKIFLNKEKTLFLNFTLFHNYFRQDSQLELTDPENDFKYLMNFSANEILGNPKDELPLATSVFNFID